MYIKKKTWITVIPLGGHYKGQCLCDDVGLNGEHDHCVNVRLHLFIIIKPTIPLNCIFINFLLPQLQRKHSKDQM